MLPDFGAYLAGFTTALADSTVGAFVSFLLAVTIVARAVEWLRGSGRN